MGLQLSKEMPSGVTGEYWRVTDLRLDKDVSTRCQVSLFKDQAARSAGKMPLTVLDLQWNDGDNPCTVAAMASADPFALTYAKLKTLADFAGAVDA